ncbi:MAG: hypothetical protein SFU98_16375 [Leptospiraceae bacterium]|nr:hypothetical protein [Leptospiraceae bacterium]
MKSKIEKHKATKKLFRSPSEKITSLNEFIEKSDYDVITKRVINKKGRKRGKVILFRDTAEEFVENLHDDCKNHPENNHTSPNECELVTMRENVPDFCLFGKTCISDSVNKILLAEVDESKIEKNVEDYKSGAFQAITDEELSMILNDEDVF